MKLSQQIASQFREMYLNGHWVATNLKEQLSDVDRKRSTKRIGEHNTIAALAFHINYYVTGQIQVLEGGPLEISDKFSFDMPSIENAEDWEGLRKKITNDGEQYAALIEQLSDNDLKQPFTDEKYGNYYRNLLVVIEHSYYHLGQIALLKKLIP
mgnify:CR=1 FL=1